MADRPIPSFFIEWTKLVERYGRAVTSDICVIDGYAQRFSNREARLYAVNLLERAAWNLGHLRKFDEHQLVRQRALAIWRLRQQLDKPPL
jgi:hypothetical protein